jgi:hypothetical protein
MPREATGIKCWIHGCRRFQSVIVERINLPLSAGAGLEGGEPVPGLCIAASVVHLTRGQTQAWRECDLNRRLARAV